MRTPGKILVGIVALTFFLTVASSARADSFNWTYSDTTSASCCNKYGTDVTASGTLTTGAISGGEATITSITGTVNGTAIAGLLSTSSGFDGNDNILVYPAGTAYLTGNGVSFSLVGGDEVNMYFSLGTYNMFDSVYFDSNYPFAGINSFEGTLTLTPIAAPEPGTILLLGLGLVMLFVLARLKQGSPVLRC